MRQNDLRRGLLLAAAIALVACGDEPQPVENARPAELGVLAGSELRFARTLVAPYASTDYGPAAHVGTRSEAFHRGVCMEALVRLADARANGEPVDASHRGVTLLRDHLPGLFAGVGDDVFTKPASGAICLMATRLAGDALTADELAPLYAAFAALARFVVEERNAHWFGVEKWDGTVDPGNSQAEELGFTASFLVAAGKLLPDVQGAFGAAERDACLAEAQRMVALSHTACNVETPTAETPACPFATCDASDPECVDGRRWLVANHGMTPHPIYTASLLTSYAEMAMIHRQLGEEVPSWLPGPETIDPLIGAVAARLREDPDPVHGHRAFSVLGDFDRVDAGGAHLPDEYPNLAYTLRNQLPPTTRLDAFSTAYDNALGMTRGYIVRGEGIWHYRCDAGGCAPTYAQPLATLWSKATWTQSPPFAVELPPDDVQSLSQFYRRVDGAERLGTLVKSGERLWYYECHQLDGKTEVVCDPCYTRTAAEEISAVTCPANATCTPPPADADLSVTYDNHLDRLRVYLTSGDRIWHYRCESQVACQATACEWVYTAMPLADLWESVEDAPARFTDAAGAYQELPRQDIDALTQSYRQNTGDDTDVLATYVVRGNRIWHYTCSYENDAPRCRAQYTKTLAQTWAGITAGDTFEAWPVTLGAPWPADAVARVDRGVVDWGFDGTVQNSAWAAGLALGSGAIEARYAALHTEQEARFGECSTETCQRPWLPPSFADDTRGLEWSFSPLPALAEADVIAALTDRWGQRPDQDVKLNTHWFFNMLAGYNHAVAWMLLTPEAKLFVQE
ncbi:MAG: hypothetical protein WKG00_23610 [Polyangiaceae bacterium]